MKTESAKLVARTSSSPVSRVSVILAQNITLLYGVVWGVGHSWECMGTVEENKNTDRVVYIVPSLRVVLACEY